MFRRACCGAPNVHVGGFAFRPRANFKCVSFIRLPDLIKLLSVANPFMIDFGVVFFRKLIHGGFWGFPFMLDFGVAFDIQRTL